MAYIYDKVRVGNQIRRLRQKLGWTQEQAAERIEKSLIFYSRIELGQTGMSFQTLLDICSVFGVTPDEILLEHHSEETLANIEWIAKRMAVLPAKRRQTAIELFKLYLDDIEDIYHDNSKDDQTVPKDME